MGESVRHLFTKPISLFCPHDVLGMGLRRVLSWYASIPVEPSLMLMSTQNIPVYGCLKSYQAALKIPQSYNAFSTGLPPRLAFLEVGKPQKLVTRFRAIYQGRPLRFDLYVSDRMGYWTAKP